MVTPTTADIWHGYNYTRKQQQLLIIADTLPNPELIAWQANGYDWAARVLHSSAFILICYQNHRILLRLSHVIFGLKFPTRHFSLHYQVYRE